VSSQTRKPSFPPRPKPTNFSSPATPLKIHKLTRAEMDEHQLKEQNNFMVVIEDLSKEDVVVPPMEELPPPSDLTPPYDPPNIDLMISLNALIGFSAP
jgi:hypothetical protein